MEPYEITLLLLGMTRIGKTTKVGALSACPERFMQMINECANIPLNEPRKKISTIIDWALCTNSVQDNKNIGESSNFRLTEICLDYENIFNIVQNKDRSHQQKYINCKYFMNDMLDFDLDNLAGLANDEIRKIVDCELKKFIKNSMFDEISCDMHSEKRSQLPKLLVSQYTGEYVKRMRVEVLACKELCKFLDDHCLNSLVLRDAMSLRPTNPYSEEDWNKFYDSKGVDGALLICSSDKFERYFAKNFRMKYRKKLEFVPVFIEARSGSLFSMYQSHYKDMSVDEFLTQLRKDNFFSQNMMFTHFVNGLRLLETLGVVDVSCDVNYSITYNACSLEDSLYAIPVIDSLACLEGKDVNEVNFVVNHDYKFYKSVCLDNVFRMVKLIIRQKALWNKMASDKSEHEKFANFCKNRIGSDNKYMVPGYRDGGRTAVCEYIETLDWYLGERGGISYENPIDGLLCRHTYTCAATAYKCIKQGMDYYKLEKTFDDFRDENDAPLKPDRLFHLYLSKRLDEVSFWSSARNYMLIDTNITIEAMKEVKSKGEQNDNSDILTRVVRAIIDKIFIL